MANDLAIKSSDSTSRKLYKIYRSKLQKFLESSNDCNAEVLLRYLPSEVRILPYEGMTMLLVIA